MQTGMQPGSALVIGEALTDIVVDVAEAGHGEQDHPGGSPFNVAITLGRLGDTVSLLTAIGDDARGAEIASRLEDSSVQLLPASRRAGPTSTARAELQPDGSARYVFEIDWSLPAGLSLAPSAVTHSGSISLFLEPGATRVAELLRTRHGDSLITLDPNIRPALVGSHADALARFESLLNTVDLVKLSDEDAAWLYPGVAPAAVLSGLVARGPGLAVMTLGGRGSLLASRAAVLEVPAPPTVVADTIGAGDSYMGALIHRVLTTSLGMQLQRRSELRSEELGAIGAFASKVAAITVSRRGANPPRLDEVV
jgi:fructokinase